MTLRDVLIGQLKDINAVENQMLKILFKAVERASSECLRKTLQRHAERLENQMARLDEALAILGQKQQRRKTTTFVQLGDESHTLLESTAEPAVFDAVLLALCHKIEHYGIATYSCMIAWAESLRLKEIGYLLRETLAEKEEAETALRTFAQKGCKADTVDAGIWPAEVFSLAPRTGRSLNGLPRWQAVRSGLLARDSSGAPNGFTAHTE